MIGASGSGAIERGEIDPPVDVQTLMAILMSVGEGMAINDLPARGAAARPNRESLSAPCSSACSGQPTGGVAREGLNPTAISLFRSW